MAQDRHVFGNHAGGAGAVARMGPQVVHYIVRPRLQWATYTRVAYALFLADFENRESNTRF